MFAENQCINYILDNGISDFKRDYFVDCLSHFDYIESFYLQYGKIPDKFSIASKFEGFKLFSVTEPKDALLVRLKEEAFAKKLIPVYNRCSDMIANGDAITAANLMSEAIVEIRNQLKSEIDLPVIDLTDYDYKVAEYKAVIEGQAMWSTGFPELDALFGGWSSEDLVVLFARLGVGKSWVAIKFAYELVKQGKRVGFYAGEMSAAKLSLRMDSFHSNVSNFSLAMGRVPENDYREIAKQMSNLPGKMLVLTPKELKDSANIATLRAFIESRKLDCLFIDQISLIKRNGKMSTHDAIDQIANELRTLQSVYGIPIFIVSQQNRASLVESEVGAEHIAQSDAIGQNATIAIALEYDKETKLLTNNVVKSRNSETAKFQYLWDIDKGRMTYIPGDKSVVATTDPTDYDDRGGRQF